MNDEMIKQMKVFNWWSSKKANSNATAEIIFKISRTSFSFPTVSSKYFIHLYNLIVSVLLDIGLLVLTANTKYKTF